LDDSKEKKLFVSKILNKIKVYFTNKINNKTNKKMIILSGFDNNIIDIIVNLFNTDAIRGKINEALHDEKIYNFLIPPLASSFLFELILHMSYLTKVCTIMAHQNVKLKKWACCVIILLDQNP